MKGSWIPSSYFFFLSLLQMTLSSSLHGEERTPSGPAKETGLPGT